MARLNPKNVRFDVGSGGILEFTAQDVAGALALVEAGLGRELMIRVWWPDGAAMTRSQVLWLIEQAQLAEWAKRESAMVDAMIAVAMHVSRATALYAEAHARRWPNVTVSEHGLRKRSEGYGLLRDAVLGEICGTGLCADCGGRGFIQNDFGVSLSCATCTGSGHHRVSDRERAQAMQRALKTFQTEWQDVYVWTYQHCMDALVRATRQMLDACE